MLPGPVVQVVTGVAMLQHHGSRLDTSPATLLAQESSAFRHGLDNLANTTIVFSKKKLNGYSSTLRQSTLHFWSLWASLAHDIHGVRTACPVVLGRILHNGYPLERYILRQTLNQLILSYFHILNNLQTVFRRFLHHQLNLSSTIE